jgi:hypothetical protein
MTVWMTTYVMNIGGATLASGPEIAGKFGHDFGRANPGVKKSK